MNKVIMMGRLTRDPELTYTNRTAEQMAIARFSLAVDRKFKREGEPDADFFNCTTFGKQAEFAEKYLHQGTKIVVCGRIQNDNYTNREGQKVYSVRIMVEEIEFAESKNTQNNTQSRTPDNDQTIQSDGFMNIPQGMRNDLPFGN